MTIKPGKLLRDQLNQDLEAARNTEQHNRKSVIHKPQAAEALESHINDAMARVLKLEDDRETLEVNDAKIAERDRESNLIRAWRSGKTVASPW